MNITNITEICTSIYQEGRYVMFFGEKQRKGLRIYFENLFVL